MSGSDVERATNALRLLSETCSAAIDALQQSPSSASPSVASPSCPVLHKDFLSLLSLVYTSITKLTLTLRPQEPVHVAALGPLRDLAANITSLTTCATLFDAHGRTLAEETKLAAKEVCETVQALAWTFLEEGGAAYLVRTGAVHDLIDKARRELSVDNHAAVRKLWASDREILEDVLGELASMIEDSSTEGVDEGEDEEFGDNEWDELGLGSSKKMTEIELDRARKVQPLLRLIILLHKRIMLDILSPVPPITSSPQTFDTFPTHSHSLLVVSEELVASLYASQDPPNIVSAISSLADTVRQLRVALADRDLLPSARKVEELVEGVGAVNVGVESRKSGEKERDVRRWYDTCFEQIDRLAKNIGDTLVLDTSNGT